MIGSRSLLAVALAVSACGYDVPLGFDDAGTCGAVRVGGLGLDPSFGGCAPVVVDVGRVDNGGVGTNALAVDVEGRPLVIGTGARVGEVPRFMALVRLTERGVTDPSFGREGVAELGYTTITRGHAVAARSDGTIAVAGSGRTLGDEPIALVGLFDSQGALVPSFGMNGVEKIGVPLGALGECRGVVTRGDGKIVCSGAFWPAFPGPGDGQVALLQTNGLPDPAFGVMGSRVFSLAGDDQFGPGALLSGDRLVMAGTSDQDVGFARLDAQGRLDSTFTDGRSPGGRARYDFEGAADGCLSVLALPDDGALCAGFATVGGVRRGALVKVTSSGALDSSFGSGGRLALAAPWTTAYAVIAWRGGFLVAGEASSAMALQALDASGASAGEVALIDVTSREDSARALVVDGKGRVVVAGVAGAGSGNDDLVVVRLILETTRVDVQGCASAPDGAWWLIAAAGAVARRRRTPKRTLGKA